MESHALITRLDENRERLRQLLLPRPGDDGSFPRSAVMRLAFNPGTRRVAMSLLSAILMLRGRGKRHVPGMSLLPQITRSLGALIGTRRR